MQDNIKNNKKIIAAGITFLILAVIAVSYISTNNDMRTHTQDDIELDSQSAAVLTSTSVVVKEEVATTTQITHLPTPKPLKGLYMTSWVAGTNAMRDHVIHLLDTTEANAVVIDLKDYSGNITYPVDDPKLKAVGSVDRRIPSLKNLTTLLHSKGVYVIGRIACFQDPYFVKLHPEYAMKKATDNTVVWTDHKGLTWLDPGEQPVWDYLILVSNDAYAQGVDEIQFDYTRFPSDGDMKNIYYPISEGKDRASVINDFWTYLNTNLHGKGPVMSVDIFGLATSAKDDLGIGQNLENALRNFDYVSPMVYPSHYASGWDDFKDPQAHPYEVVKRAMDDGVSRAQVLNIDSLKLRPWLQDFGLYGEKYGPVEVRDQIKATTDAGLDSWILWDAANVFTAGALLPEASTSTVTSMAR